MLERAVCNECESGLLFASRLQFLAGPFAMSLSPEAFLFAMIVGRKVSLFASPRHPVRKPQQLGATVDLTNRVNHDEGWTMRRNIQV